MSEKAQNTTPPTLFWSMEVEEALGFSFLKSVRLAVWHYFSWYLGLGGKRQFCRLVPKRPSFRHSRFNPVKDGAQNQVFRNHFFLGLGFPESSNWHIGRKSKALTFNQQYTKVCKACLMSYLVIWKWSHMCFIAVKITCRENVIWCLQYSMPAIRVRKGRLDALKSHHSIAIKGQNYFNLLVLS